MQRAFSAIGGLEKTLAFERFASRSFRRPPGAACGSQISRSLLKFVKQRETRAAASREPLSPSFTELLTALFKSRLKVSLAAFASVSLMLKQISGWRRLQSAVSRPQSAVAVCSWRRLQSAVSRPQSAVAVCSWWLCK